MNLQCVVDAMWRALALTDLPVCEEDARTNDAGDVVAASYKHRVGLMRAELRKGVQALHDNVNEPAPVQLYACVKRTSKYYHQQRNPEPFPVTIYGYSDYVIHGLGNQYRVADLHFFVKRNGQFIALK